MDDLQRFVRGIECPLNGSLRVAASPPRRTTALKWGGGCGYPRKIPPL